MSEGYEILIEKLRKWNHGSFYHRIKYAPKFRDTKTSKSNDDRRILFCQRSLVKASSNVTP